MRFKHRDTEYLMPDEWWAESGIDSSSNHAFVSGPSPWPALPVFTLRLMNQQANNAEETRFGAFLKASQTLAERERQRFHGLGLTIL